MNPNTRPFLKASFSSMLAAGAFLFAGCSPSSEVKVLSNPVKILSNPDNVEIACRVYAVKDPQLAAINFVRFMQSEELGAGTRRSNPQKLQGYESLSNTIALVVERKIHDGATLKASDYGASLIGVNQVPEEYKNDLRNGNCFAAGSTGDFTILSEETVRQGRMVETIVRKGGTIKFVWFLPKGNRKCEMAIGSAKPVNIEILSPD